MIKITSNFVLWRLTQKVGYGWAVIISYILTTIVLIPVSYFLTIWVDEPCKNYVYELEKDYRMGKTKQSKKTLREKIMKHKTALVFFYFLFIVYIISLIEVEKTW